MSKNSKDLLRFQPNNRIVFDFESFSLQLGDEMLNRPWQIGWLVIENNKVVQSNEDWIYWDDIDDVMSKEAAQITGFNKSVYLKKAQDSISILSKFNEFFYDKDYLILAANPHGFDVYLHNLWQRFHGLKTDFSYLERLICIQNLHKAKVLESKLPDLRTKEWACFNYKLYNYKERGLKTNLKFLAGEYDVPYDETKHHVSALYDVELTDDIFKKQIFKIEV
jgi:hypothetical protein